MSVEPYDDGYICILRPKRYKDKDYFKISKTVDLGNSLNYLSYKDHDIVHYSYCLSVLKCKRNIMNCLDKLDLMLGKGLYNVQQKELIDIVNNSVNEQNSKVYKYVKSDTYIGYKRLYYALKIKDVSSIILENNKSIVLNYKKLYEQEIKINNKLLSEINYKLDEKIFYDNIHNMTLFSSCITIGGETYDINGFIDKLINKKIIVNHINDKNSDKNSDKLNDKIIDKKDNFESLLNGLKLNKDDMEDHENGNDEWVNEPIVNESMNEWVNESMIDNNNNNVNNNNNNDIKLCYNLTTIIQNENQLLKVIEQKANIDVSNLHDHYLGKIYKNFIENDNTIIDVISYNNKFQNLSQMIVKSDNLNIYDYIKCLKNNTNVINIENYIFNVFICDIMICGLIPAFQLNENWYISVCLDENIERHYIKFQLDENNDIMTEEFG